MFQEVNSKSHHVLFNIKIQSHILKSKDLLKSSNKLTFTVSNTSNVSTRWVADLDILTLITTSTIDTSSYYLKNRLNLDTTEKLYILKNEGTNVSLTLGKTEQSALE